MTFQGGTSAARHTSKYRQWSAAPLLISSSFGVIPLRRLAERDLPATRIAIFPLVNLDLFLLLFKAGVLIFEPDNRY